MPAWASSWRSSTTTRATGPGTAPTHTRADTSRIAGLAARSAEGAPHSQPVLAASTLFIGTACSAPSPCTATRRRAQRRRGELVEDYGIDRVGSSDFPGLNVAHTFRGTAPVEASDLRVASSRRCRADGRSARSAAAADVDGRDGVGGDRALAGVRVVGCVGVGTMAGVALGDLVGGHRRFAAHERAGGCPWASSSTTSAASHARRGAPHAHRRRSRRGDAVGGLGGGSVVVAVAAVAVLRRAGAAVGARRRRLGRPSG